MRFELLAADKAEQAVALFYHAFKAAEGEAEAKSVSGLVSKFFGNYPRQGLIGFAACSEDELAGTVFFSELSYPEDHHSVYLLSPMAVKTSYQGKGIGRRLIHFAHEHLKKRNVNLTLTYGDIRFYSKAGYQPVSETDIAAPFKLTYPEGWLVCRLDGRSPAIIKGPSQCIAELADQSYW